MCNPDGGNSHPHTTKCFSQCHYQILKDKQTVVRPGTVFPQLWRFREEGTEVWIPFPVLFLRTVECEKVLLLISSEIDNANLGSIHLRGSPDTL